MKGRIPKTCILESLRAIGFVSTIRANGLAVTATRFILAFLGAALSRKLGVMIVLVDYDNVHELHRQRGLPHLVQRIADAIGINVLQSLPRLRIRLYGGWFERLQSTRRAQLLAAEVARFPIQVTVTNSSTTHALIASAELALGLLNEPRVFLTHTFRPRGLTGTLACSAPPFPGCKNTATCPLPSFRALVSAGRCTESGCQVLLEGILSRPEQKLVDTLLISDLVHIAYTSNDPVAVVSTDDDMWPGIRLALSRGIRVVHIHPVPRRQTPTHYLVAIPPGYSQSTLN